MSKTNKLFEYGLEAAKVGKILLEPELKTPTPQRTLTGAAHYWPTEALSFANAAACVDIVLLRSQEASTAYYEAAKALELPGCQVLISDTKKAVLAYAPNLQQFTHKYWLPNPLFPFIWFRVAVPGTHPDIQVEEYDCAA